MGGAIGEVAQPVGDDRPLAGDEQEFGQADTGSWLVMIVERRT